MRLAVYVFAGFVLLLLNLWYIRSVYRTYFSRDMPEVVAPFLCVGRDDPKGDKGRALAQLLVSRLYSLQREINRAEEALQETTANPSAPRPGAPRIVDRPSEIFLNTRVLAVPDVQVKVSGVEVSNLLNWAYRTIGEGRAIRVSLFYPEGVQKVTVAAGLETNGLDDIWIADLATDDRTVVDEIAKEIIRLLLIRERRIPEATALDRQEFSRLVSSLKTLADLNRKVRQGYTPAPSQYAELVNSLEPIIERTPEWRVLINLTAEAAENGRDLPKARDLFRRELALLDRNKDSELYNNLSQRIEKLTAKLETPALAAAAVEAPSPVVTTWPGNLLAVPSGAVMRGAPRVAVLGGVPLPDFLKRLDHEVVNEAEEVEADPVMSEHIATLIETVQLIAPRAHYLFAKIPSSTSLGLSESDLLRSVETLSAHKPDVLLVDFSTPEPSPAYISEFARVAKLCPVVVAGGNEGPQSPVLFTQANLLDDLISVDAVDKRGLPAEFSSKSDRAFWAPGVDIPLKLIVDNRSTPQIRDGTSYAAALAAGVVARVLDANEDLKSKPQDVIRLLRETSKPVVDGGPPILNVARALEKSKGR
jgi:hypothetical protein